MLLHSRDHARFVGQVQTDRTNACLLEGIELLLGMDAGDYVSLGKKRVAARSKVGND